MLTLLFGITCAVLIIIIIIAIIFVISEIWPQYFIKKVEEKKDYMDLGWLNDQYYSLGRSIQDIANEQGVSLITIRKWIDKLENTSN